MEIPRWERWFYLIIPNSILKKILPIFPKFRFLEETRDSQRPIDFNIWYNHKITGNHKSTYWPVHPTSKIVNSTNIYCGIDTSPGYSPGNYIQAIGKIYIGDYTLIAPNVGIISANHDLFDNRKHIKKEVHIGKYCWIGMGAVILPGVRLGDYTIVGAGSIVTKSFEEGFCVLAGNPAKLVKKIDPTDCILRTSTYEYNGYIPASSFESYRVKNLNV